MKALTFKPTPAPRNSQRGIALIVALVLLLVATVLGISSIRNTSLQERMSGNQYDRSLAMQAAESGLRAAQTAITEAQNPAAIPNAINCNIQPLPNFCTVTVPNGDPFLGNDGWNSIPADDRINTGLTVGTPQYHITFMVEEEGDDLYEQLASGPECAMYGNNCDQPRANFYRITSRSSAPIANSSRASVALQSIMRRDL